MNEGFYKLADIAALQSAPIFSMFRWTYGAEGEIPTFDQLRNTILSLLEDVERQGDHTSAVSSGRFTVSRVNYEDIGVRYSVKLDLAESDES